ncbi:MAG: winged helix-turn-helix domain-containing protein [Acetobacteraceae bacterium]|nr:winged helix-turn-helix domain-containing protein [Acetobacteraceae bacterium]
MSFPEARVHFASPEDGLRLAHDADVVVVDCAEAAGAGMGTLGALRGADLACPVILIAAEADAALRAGAYDAGADAVVLRSRAPATLAASIAAARRRSRPRRSTQLVCGNVTLDDAAGRITVAGRPVDATPCELGVLKVLMAAQGATIPKEALSAHLSEHSREPDGTVLRVFICRLRRKLSACGADDVIRTVWGVGYRVEAPGALRAAAASRAGLPLAPVSGDDWPRTAA